MSSFLWYLDTELSEQICLDKILKENSLKNTLKNMAFFHCVMEAMEAMSVLSYIYLVFFSHFASIYLASD